MRKSSLLTFFFSLFPGLGHLYLGLMHRGLSMMAVFFGWIALVGALSGLARTDKFMILLVLLPVIWFYSLFDALNLCLRMQQGEHPVDLSPLVELGHSLEAGRRSRLWALLFSIVPGAGHMYLGWQEKGLGLMLAFFGALFLLDWLHLSLFLFLLPVIWFYGLFDALQLVSGEEAAPPARASLLAWVAQRQRWVGIGLIVLGGVVLFDNLVAPYLTYQLQNLLRTGLVAALFIGGGLRLALGSTVAPPEGGTTGERKEEE